MFVTALLESPTKKEARYTRHRHRDIEPKLGPPPTAALHAAHVHAKAMEYCATTA